MLYTINSPQIFLKFFTHNLLNKYKYIYKRKLLCPNCKTDINTLNLHI